MTRAQRRAVAAHQPGQDVFKSVPSGRHQLETLRGVSTFGPPGCHRASTLGGRTLQDHGANVCGVKLMPNRHPEDRGYRVISGVFYIGLGQQFNPEKLDIEPFYCIERAL